MIRPIISAVIAFLVLAGPSPVFAQGEAPADRVRDLSSTFRFDEAIRLADLYLHEDSAQPGLLALKGGAQVATYRYREAIESFRKALSFDSLNVAVLTELANVFRASGNLSEASEVLRQLIRIDPDNPWFRIQLANLYAGADEYRLAASILRPLCDADSSGYFLPRQLGLCYNELKQNDSAVYYYRRALRAIPCDPFVTGKLINALIRTNEVLLALYEAEQCLATDSLNIPILRQSAYCYYLLQDYREAGLRLLRCLHRGDSSAFTLKYLGLSYYKHEQYDSAAPLFRAAFAADTSNSELCFYYGVSAGRSNAPDTALVYLARAMRLLLPPRGFLSSLLLELADAYNATGSPDSALSTLLKARDEHPENNILRFKIAYQYDYYLRKPFDALPWYREFLKNESTEVASASAVPLHVSRSDYSRKRIREIAPHEAR